MVKIIINEGDKVIAINIKPLEGNTVAPPLELDKEYKIKEIVLDSKGNSHFDVGLKSQFNWITSYETKEPIPRGDLIHWCHPSRFLLSI